MKPLTLSEASQSPLPLDVTWADDTTEHFNLPLLRIRDYAEWLDALTAQRKAKARELLPKMLAPKDRFIAERSIEIDAATFADVWREVQTPAGAERVIDTSMKLAGIADDKRAKLLALLPVREATRLAADLSTLFEPAEPAPEPVKEGGKASPLPIPSTSGASQPNEPG